MSEAADPARTSPQPRRDGHPTDAVDDDDGEATTLAEPSLSAAAFNAMYPELRRLAAVVAPPGVEADDLVHDAVARVLARIRRSGTVDDPKAYLARTIINLARSRRRRWAARRSTVTPSPRIINADAPEPDAVSAWLDLLQPRQRACLWLRFVQDRSVQDTAELLGCSPGTVKSQTAKALDNLRRAGLADPTVADLESAHPRDETTRSRPDLHPEVTPQPEGPAAPSPIDQKAGTP
jgi:RNA polymerase sigma factor (sigma-70 family)